MVRRNDICQTFALVGASICSVASGAYALATLGTRDIMGTCSTGALFSLPVAGGLILMAYDSYADKIRIQDIEKQQFDVRATHHKIRAPFPVSTVGKIFGTTLLVGSTGLVGLSAATGGVIGYGVGATIGYSVEAVRHSRLGKSIFRSPKL